MTFGSIDFYKKDTKSLIKNIPVGTLPPPRLEKTFSVFGDARLSTNIPKIGTASGSFDGTGDYIKTQNFNDYTNMSGDCTLEAWVKFNIMPADQTAGSGSYMVFYFSEANSSGTVAVEPFFIIGNDTSNHPVIDYGIKRSTSSVYGTWKHTGKTITTGVWYHFAIVKYQGIWKAYWDGSQFDTQSGTALASTDVPLYYPYFNIGAWPQQGRGYWNGNIDEIRFSMVARYTNDFTPSTIPFVNDSGTCLLLHMDGIDGSTNFIDTTS